MVLLIFIWTSLLTLLPPPKLQRCAFGRRLRCGDSSRSAWQHPCYATLVRRLESDSVPKCTSLSALFSQYQLPTVSIFFPFSFSFLSPPSFSTVHTLSHYPHPLILSPSHTVYTLSLCLHPPTLSTPHTIHTFSHCPHPLTLIY